MDLASRIRLDNSEAKVADRAAYKLVKMFTRDAKDAAAVGGVKRSQLRDRINQILPIDQVVLDNAIKQSIGARLLAHNKNFNPQVLRQAVSKKLNSYIQNYSRLPIKDPTFSYAKATPLQDLLKNPANKVISKGTFNGQKVDPYRRGFAGKDASEFSDLFIDKLNIGQVNYISAYPEVAGGYAAQHPDDIVLQYDMSKLRDVNKMPLMWGPHQSINNRFKIIKNRANTPEFFDQHKGWSGRPYYQTVSINQSGYMPWNAIKNIYKPMTDAKDHQQYLKLNNWRDAFRPSKTLDMYTQLYS